MDVRLPNGSVVRNVPEGTTKQQLVERLASAGLIDLPQTDVRAAAAEAVAGEAAKLGTGQNVLVGAGRGLNDIYQGGRQIANRLEDTPALLRGVLNALPAGALVNAVLAAGTKPSERTKSYDAQVANELENVLPLQDSTAFNVGRIGGQIAATLPVGGLSALVSKPFTGTALRAVLARGAASGAAQGAVTGALQPVRDAGNFAAEKAGQVVLGAGGGAVAGAAVSGAARGVENMLPSNALKRLVANRAAAPRNAAVAAEGEAVARRTGIELPLGARTGSRSVTMLENAARQSFLTADRARAVDEKIAQQAAARVGKIMDGLSARDASAASVGAAVQGSIDRVTRRVIAMRESSAQRMYRPISQAASGRKIAVSNAARVAEEIAEEYNGVAGQVAKRIFAQASALLDDLSGPMTIEKALRNRSAFSRASAGIGNVFDDLSTAEQRRYGARLAKAIEKDFDDMAADIGADLGGMLRQANAAYRKHSQVIEAFEGSILGKALGADVGGAFRSIAPEKVFDRIRQATPQEVRVAAEILRAGDPDTLQLVKRGFLQQALTEAETDVATSGVAPLALNPARFINTIAKKSRDYDRLREVFEPNELAQIDDVLNALRRWGDQTGRNFSGTAPMMEMLDFARSISVKGAATVGGQLVGLRKVVDLMANPQSRAQLLQLTRLEPSSVGAQKIAASIAAQALATPQAAAAPDRKSTDTAR